jgi:hypothetical protein
MAEQFDHRDLIITLAAKGRVPIGLPGQPAPRPQLTQIVEVNLRGKDGHWHQVEMPLEEFHELLYKKVFPAVARRMQAILRKKS